MNNKIKFYNTLTRSLDEFVPIENNTVKIYSCGPTVYDYAHIGNFRSYIFSDLLRRFLKYKGYKVIHTMNLTDVDDKTINRSKQENLTLKKYTDKYIKIFFEDLDTLKIERVEYYPRATDHIKDMIGLIKKLEKNGYIYESGGSIYYNISKFKDYGKLSKIDLSGMKKGVRIDVDEYDKEDVRDFVLWKGKKEGEPYWETEYGAGRPGWHIECSAMSMKYLGETFDIHTGGVDLVFPHHENEIAQSEGATGKPFVKYWLHCAHLIVNNEKMSKSAGNFFTLRDLLNKGYDKNAIRYLLLSTHYRKQLNFTEDGIKASQQAVEKLQTFYNNLLNMKSFSDTDFGYSAVLKKAIEKFDTNLENDLNISGALGELFNLLHTTNKFIEENKLQKTDRDLVIEKLKNINSILAVIDEEGTAEPLGKEIEQLIEQRQQARERKDFKLADEIRDKLLNEFNVILEDTKEGVRWRKKS